MHAHAVGRVGDQHARGCGRFPVQQVVLSDVDPLGEPGRLRVGATVREDPRIDVRSEDSEGGGCLALPVVRALPDALPGGPVEPGEFLETEGAGESRCAIGGERSAASMAIVPLPHIGSRNGVPGVQPASAAMPAARFSRSGASSASRAPAALEQRLARSVEIERRLALGEEGVDANVGALLVDGRPAADGVAEAVADGVLHAQRRELEARAAATASRRRRREACARP